MEVNAIDVPIGGMFGWGRSGATYIRVSPEDTTWKLGAKEGLVVVALVITESEFSSRSMRLTSFGKDTVVELLTT